MADDLMLPELDDLLELIRSTGVKASMNAEDLNLPGVWLAVDTVRTINLAGDLELGCLLFIISPDQDSRRSIGTLSGIYRQLATVLTPDGQVLTQGVVMPGDPTPLPALRVPVNLYTGSE